MEGAFAALAPCSVAIDLLLIVLGVALLYAGAEALVRGASALALRSGLSPLLVGLTVVAFGTSAPELVVSVQAALEGRGGIAAGNVVGSNVANVGLILGLAAVVRPLRVDPQLLRFDIPLTIGISVLAAVLLADRALGRAEGAVLVLGLLAYVLVSIRLARRDPTRAAELLLPEELAPARPVGSRGRDLSFVVGGLLLLGLGSESLVRGASHLAEVLGVPPTVVGLTVVAVGTSLPELATSLLASARGEGDLAVGNVVGSNLFNLLGILGLSAVVRPLRIDGLEGLDIGAMLAAVLLLLPLAATHRLLHRLEGAGLTLLYAAYVALLVFRATGAS